ncbi:MAG: PD40 domain-containing protein [Nitrospirae bacterium]|nr:PD40 domain-containing protein [Nitrospirota bacterium]
MKTLRIKTIIILFLALILPSGISAVDITNDSADIYVPLKTILNRGGKIKTLDGHSIVISVSFSPDGKMLASGNYDKTIILWDTATGEKIRTLKSDGIAIFVSFSPDGKTLASCGDKIILIWDVATGQKIKTLTGHSDSSVNSLSFSPDGKMLASGSLDKTVILWDISKGKKIKTLISGPYSVYSVSFSPDGKTLASGGPGGTVVLWDVATGQKIKMLSGYPGSSVNSISFSPDGKILASGGLDKTVMLWDISKGKKIKTLNSGPYSVYSVSFSPDGNTLASGGLGGTVVLWDAATGEKITTLNGHSDRSVNSISFSPDGKILASGGEDNTIILWNMEIAGTVSLWQDPPQKGEFETNDEHKQRLQNFRGKMVRFRTNIPFGTYNADKEFFKAEIFGNHAFIQVPRETAKDLARRKKRLYIEGALEYFNPETAKLVNPYIIDDMTGEKFAFGKHTDKLIAASIPDNQAFTGNLNAVPELSYEAVIDDSDHDGILEGGENVALSVKIRNTGKGTAKGTGVVLSGDSTLLNVIGRSRDLGDILPSEEKTVEFKGVLPTEIQAGNAEFEVTVKEGKGYFPAEKKSFVMAMKPAEIRETKQVLSELSDVDIIPSKINNFTRNNSYAVVIGISRYRDEIIPGVRYAESDAQAVAKYIENIGGIPRQNIKVLTDDKATRSDLEAYIEDWLPKRTGKDSEVFIYYAGHGTPDPENSDAYLVPYDGHPDFKSKLYPLKRMYEALNKLPSGQVVVMLDSCFSGAGDRSVTKQGARPISISIENPVSAGGKISVLAASTGTQISSDYEKMKHGLFTYYLLKGMKGGADADNNKTVALGELFDYLKENVSRTASIELNRDQTPVLLPQDSFVKFEITRVR